MAPHSIDCLSRDVYKDGRIVKSARVLGMMVEMYFRLCFEIGGNSVTPGSFPNTVRVKLDNLGERDVLLNQALRIPAMNIGEDIRTELSERGYHILRCNVPVKIGGVKVGEHDLICDVRWRGGGARPVSGRFSVEVKLRRVSNSNHDSHLRSLRSILEEECWERVKMRNGKYVPHWWQTVAHEKPFWAGRILVLCELPEDEAKMSPFKLRADRRLLGGSWTHFFGWHGYGPLPQPKPKAAPKALPKAVAAAPKASPKAAPAPAKESWSSFKGKLTWKKITPNGPKVAGVKQFLLKAQKPCTNSRKSLKSWQTSILPGPLQTRYSYEVDRNFFDRSGNRPGGGSEMPVLTMEALKIVYDTF